MDRGLYVAMTGAKQIMQAQAVNNHNIANLSTIGFRADAVAFDSEPIYGPGYATRVNAVAGDAGTDFSAGTMESTGRDLDIAVNGTGFIAVRGTDGQEAYTRAGDLRVSPVGAVTAASDTTFHRREHRQRWNGVGRAAGLGAICRHAGRSHQAGQSAAGQSAKRRRRDAAPEERRQGQNRRDGFRDLRNAGVQQCQRGAVADQHDRAA